MATSQPKRPAAAGPADKGLRVASRSDHGFRRAGMQFGPEATVLPLSDLTDDQVAALKAERQLIVAEVDIEPAKA